MPDTTFNTPAGQEIKRELLALYLNTGTEAQPVWSIIGSRVPDSSIEMDWSTETNTDVTGVTRTNARKPVKTQSFDPYPLDSGDPALLKLWNIAVEQEDNTAIVAQDVLLVHRYAGTASSAMKAFRYKSAAVIPTGLGGEGGGSLSMPIEVTFGGERIAGTAAIAAGVVTFTEAS